MPSEETVGLGLKIQFNWKSMLCVLFLFALLIRLGFWQLDRAEQKRRIEESRQSKQIAKPVPLETLIRDDKSDLKHVKVMLEGRYDNEKSILISNQIFQNQPGYEVITAFTLQSTNTIVLVSRGWIAASQNNKQLPSFESIIGRQKLTGEIYIPTKSSFFLPQKIVAPVNWPIQMHHYDSSEISQLFNKPVFPFVVRLDQTSIGVLQRHWRVTRLKPQNSLSYAIQWFGMALILVVITITKNSNIIEFIRSKQSSYTAK
jgi:cytochrome oxidase assembly protein ShyY1